MATALEQGTRGSSRRASAYLVSHCICYEAEDESFEVTGPIARILLGEGQK